MGSEEKEDDAVEGRGSARNEKHKSKLRAKRVLVLVSYACLLCYADRGGVCGESPKGFWARGFSSGADASMVSCWRRVLMLLSRGFDRQTKCDEGDSNIIAKEAGFV